MALLLGGFIPLLLCLRIRAGSSRPGIPLVAAGAMAAASLLLLAAGLGSGLLFGSDLQYGVSSTVLIVQALLAVAGAASIALIVLVSLLSLLWRRRQGPLWFRLVGSFYPGVIIAVLGYAHLIRIF